MRILFTGASSFTGMWIVQELVAQGHQVVAILPRALSSYEGLRLLRIKKLLPLCKTVFESPFGSTPFLNHVRTHGPWDLFCHHAAEVKNYKSFDFDVGQAVTTNVNHLKDVLDALMKQNCRKILLTGSVFEQNEGKGTPPLKAFSPYGLSKGLTAEIFQFYCEKLGLKLGKFVIPNPFGPYEEVRFTTFLINKWIQTEIAAVSHPDYIRDNIHVSLLAKAYAHFAAKLTEELGFEKINPSGYVGTQGDFTSLFAENMRTRLKLPCPYELQKQADFSEPLERVNLDLLSFLQWDEKQAWDDLASFYRDFYMGKKS